MNYFALYDKQNATATSLFGISIYVVRIAKTNMCLLNEILLFPRISTVKPLYNISLREGSLYI